MGAAIGLMELRGSLVLSRPPILPESIDDASEGFGARRQNCLDRPEAEANRRTSWTNSISMFSITYGLHVEITYV